MERPDNVALWSINDVSSWLDETGFDKYTARMCDTHNIDGNALLELEKDDLKQIPITALGDLHSLLQLIKSLRYRQRQLFTHNGHCHRTDQRLVTPKQYFPHEPRKALVSVAYVVGVFSVIALLLVFVHERVPHKDKYPPLPDLAFELLPRVPWVFAVTEAVIIALSCVWCVVMTFHRHRLILLRRWCCVLGTAFLLRGPTIICTALSVPDVHAECYPAKFASNWERLKRAFAIWSSCGMMLTGGGTCGDYMYSGHTVTLTLLLLFIVEYTTNKMCWLHVSTLVMTITAVVCIILDHEHYTVDVVVALYIAFGLFKYYHCLANTRPIISVNRRRSLRWFPLQAYLEANTHNIVPNEFENPFQSLKPVIHHA